MASAYGHLGSDFIWNEERYSFRSHSYRIAHDISVENFQALQDELADDSQPNEINLHLDNVNNFEAKPKNTSLFESVDSLNQKNAAHFPLSNGVVKSHLPETVLNSPAISGLRIEDVEKIGTDLIRLNIEKKEFSQPDADSVPYLKDEDTRARSSPESAEVNPKQTNKFGSFKKRRKPRKLPEIPVGSQRKTVPSRVQLKELINVHSLAEELSAADPSTSHCQQVQPSYSCNGYLYNGTQDQVVDLQDLGSPESVSELPVTADQTPVIVTRTQSQSTEDHDSNCDKSCCEHSDSMHSSVQTDFSEEFGDLAESYIDDVPVAGTSNTSRTLHDNVPVGFNTTSDSARAFLGASNPFLVEDSSPEEKSKQKSFNHGQLGKKDSTESCVRTPSSSSSTYPGELDELEATHRGCHKFIPRHPDELFIEIGDPIYVEIEADDLWCDGVNLRTGKRGIFPAAYATDLSFLEEDNDGRRPYKVNLKFLGSLEVNYHKGYDVLCQAINKVVQTRRMTLNSAPPPMCSLEINEYGIKMTDKSKKKKKLESSLSPKRGSFTQKLVKMLTSNKDKDSKNDHFFSLKNVSFCGYHPKNDKYFAFITKHPLEMRFACHVFYSEKSTKCVTEAIGTAFSKFYQEYMAFVHPTEDIYLE